MTPPVRNKPLPGEKENRVVWKPVLSTPLGIQWPEIPCAVAENLLEELLRLFGGRKTRHVGRSDCLSISQFKIELRSLKKRKMIKDQKSGSSHDDKLSEVVGKTATTTSIDPANIHSDQEIARLDDIPQPPPFLNHVLLGINTVTKAIESEIQERRKMISQPHGQITNLPMAAEDRTSHTALPPRTLNDLVHSHEVQPVLETALNCKQLLLIFVCKEDLNPISLVEHLLPAVATLNQHRSPQDPVLLVPLLKGAEERISTALGIKRAAVLGLHGREYLSELYQFAEKHTKPVLPPNLSHDKLKNTTINRPKDKQLKLIPTHVKYYKTTTPVDMRKHQMEKSNHKRQLKALRKQNIDSNSNDAKYKHKRTRRKLLAKHKTAAAVTL